MALDVTADLDHDSNRIHSKRNKYAMGEKIKVSVDLHVEINNSPGCYW